jgi:hypothetical protein
MESFPLLIPPYFSLFFSSVGIGSLDKRQNKLTTQHWKEKQDNHQKLGKHERNPWDNGDDGTRKCRQTCNGRR